MPAVFSWLVTPGGSIAAGAAGLLRSLLTGTATALPEGATSALAVPLDTAASADAWTQRTRLDGRDFTFGFEWNERAGAWFFSLYDEEEEPLLLSKKLVVERDLLFGLVGSTRPAGSLLLLEVSGALTEAGRTSLETTHQLVYVT